MRLTSQTYVVQEWTYAAQRIFFMDSLIVVMIEESVAADMSMG